MKRFVILITVIVACVLAGCARSKVIDGVEYQPCGVMNQDVKQDGIVYRVSPGNMVWAILGCETIVVPVVIVGWYLWEPSHKVNHPTPSTE